MNKRFFIPACVLTVAAIVFIVAACSHPELSLPIDHSYQSVIYGLYADLVVLLFILSFWKKGKVSWFLICGIILELGAVYMLIQSIFRMLPEGKPNVYLPLALALNCVAMCLNSIHRKREKKNEEK